MTQPSAVVLVVDRLGAGFLGPYGSTWIDTPAFNHLASQSLVCEAVLSDSPGLDIVYRSFWHGLHAMSAGLISKNAGDSLPALATACGLRTILLTDDPDIAERADAAAFSECIFVAQPQASSTCAEIEGTAFARLVQRAADILEGCSDPFLLWIHSRGMQGAWDAPLSLRHQFAGDEDPLADDSAAPPLFSFEGKVDPDQLLTVLHAYGGQVSLVDACLAALLGALDEHPAHDRTLLALTAPRGYPLGEHGQVGPVADDLFGELLHVPLIIRAPGEHGGHHRSQEILQPADLGLFLKAWLSENPDTAGSGTIGSILAGREHVPRQVGCAIAPGQRAIRTPAWFLRESLGTEDQPTRYDLFAKPDDRWEVNEVSSRGADIIELLASELDRFQAAVVSGSLDGLLPLDETLCDIQR